MQIISIASGKGGTGKTTVAINLSLALANLNYKTLLIDFNFTSPHLTIFSGIEYSKTLNDLFAQQDFQNLNNYLYSFYSQNFFVLPLHLNLEKVKYINQENLNELFKNLNEFDYIILDSAPSFGKEFIYSLTYSQKIIIVTNPFLSSVIDAMKVKELAKNLQKKIIGIIVNKTKISKLEISQSEIEMLLNEKVLATIPYTKSIVECEQLRIPAFLKDKKIREIFIEIACKITNKEYKKQNILNKFLNFFSKF